PTIRLLEGIDDPSMIAGSDRIGADAGDPSGGKARGAGGSKIPGDRRRGLLRIPTRPVLARRRWRGVVLPDRPEGVEFAAGASRPPAPPGRSRPSGPCGPDPGAAPCLRQSPAT